MDTPEINQPISSTQPAVPPSPPKKNSGMLIGILLLFLGILVGLVIGKTTFLSGIRIPYLGATPTPTLLPTPSPTPDPTANWKTYEDKKWGFTVKYPEEFFTACYPDEGLKLWGPNFDCSVPHDIFYTISAIGYEDKDYKPYKKASGTEKIVIDSRNATKNTYIFDESDGPLFGLHEETEIVIPLQSGLIQLVLLGQEAKNRIFFDQILSTFRFLEPTDPRGEELKSLDTCVPTTERGANVCYAQKTKGECLKMATDCRWAIAVP